MTDINKDALDINDNPRISKLNDDINAQNSSGFFDSVKDALFGYSDFKGGGEKGVERSIKEAEGDKSFGRSVVANVSNLYESGKNSAQASIQEGYAQNLEDIANKKSFVSPDSSLEYNNEVPVTSGLIEDNYSNTKSVSASGAVDTGVNKEYVTRLSASDNALRTEIERSLNNQPPSDPRFDNIPNSANPLQQIDIFGQGRLKSEVEEELEFINIKDKVIQASDGKLTAKEVEQRAKEVKNTNIAQAEIGDYFTEAKSELESLNSELTENPANAEVVARKEELQTKVDTLQELIVGSPTEESIRQLYIDYVNPNYALIETVLPSGALNSVATSFRKAATKNKEVAAEQADKAPKKQVDSYFRNLAIDTVVGAGSLGSNIQNAAVSGTASYVASGGNPFAALAGAGAAFNVSSYGQYYDQISKESEAKGVDLSTETKMMASFGLMAFEKASLGTIGKPITNALLKKKASEAYVNYAKNLVTNPKAAKSLYKEAAKNGLKGVVVEGSQEALSNGIVQALVEVVGEGRQYTTKEVIDAAIQNATVGGILGGTIGSVGGAIGARDKRTDLERSIDEAREFLGDDNPESTESLAEPELKKVLDDAKNKPVDTDKEPSPKLNYKVLAALDDPNLELDPKDQLVINKLVKGLNRNISDSAKVNLEKKAFDILNKESVKSKIPTELLDSEVTEYNKSFINNIIKDNSIPESVRAEVENSKLALNALQNNDSATKLDVLQEQLKLSKLIESTDSINPLTVDQVTPEFLNKVYTSNLTSKAVSTKLKENLKVLDNSEVDSPAYDAAIENSYKALRNYHISPANIDSKVSNINDAVKNEADTKVKNKAEKLKSSISKAVKSEEAAIGKSIAANVNSLGKAAIKSDVEQAKLKSKVDTVAKKTLLKDPEISSEVKDRINSLDNDIRNLTAASKKSPDVEVSKTLESKKRELKEFVDSSRDENIVSNDNIDGDRINEILSSGVVTDNSTIEVLSSNSDVISKADKTSVEYKAALDVVKDKLRPLNITDSKIKAALDSKELPSKTKANSDLVLKKRIGRVLNSAGIKDVSVDVITSPDSNLKGRPARFNTTTGKVEINNEAILDGKLAKEAGMSKNDYLTWVVFHEAFHKGALATRLESEQGLYQNLIEFANKNDTVKSIVKSLRSKDHLKDESTEVLVEEALAEIAAALNSRQLDVLIDKYGLEGSEVAIKTPLKKFLALVKEKFDEVFKQVIAKINNKEVTSPTFSDIESLINVVSYNGNTFNNSKVNPDKKQGIPEYFYSPDIIRNELTESAKAGEFIVDNLAGNPLNDNPYGVKDLLSNPKKVKNFIRRKLTDHLALFRDIAKSGNEQAKKLEKAINDVVSLTTRRLEVNIEPKIGDLAKDLGSMYKSFSKKNPDRYSGAAGYANFKYDVNNILKYVLHGKERNLAVLIKSEGDFENGSGFSDAEIDAMLDYYNETREGLVSEVEALYGRSIKPILDYNQQSLIDAGLLSTDQILSGYEWNFYVPLYGHAKINDSIYQDILDEGKLEGFRNESYTNPIDVQNQLREMKGRSSESVSVFEAILQQSQITAQRVESQKLKEALLDYARTDEGKEVLRSEIETKDYDDFGDDVIDETGEITWGYSRVNKKDSGQVIYQQGSVVHTITIGNNDIFNTIKEISPPTPKGLRRLGKVTGFISKMYTSYSILLFPPKNKLRDTQQAMIYLLMDSPIGKNSSNPILAGKNIAKRTKVMARYLYLNAKYTNAGALTSNVKKEYGHTLNDYFDVVGTGSFSSFLSEVDGTGKNTNVDFLLRDEAGVAGKFEKGRHAVDNFVHKYNDHMENSSRIAMYQALIENGVSKKEAGRWTKDLMNYETKGAWGKNINKGYAFFSTALYDSGKIINAMSTGKMEPLIVASLQVVKWGLIQNMVRSLFEEDEDLYSKVDMTTAGENFMIPVGDKEGSWVKIPVGFGIDRMSKTLWEVIDRYSNGKFDNEEAMKAVVGDVILKNLSPLQVKIIRNDPVNTILQTVAPTFLSPALQLATNKNYKGNSVHANTAFLAKDKNHYESGFDWTGDSYKYAARFMFDNSFGYIDVFPETLQLFVGSYLGGSGREVFNAVDSVLSATVGTTRTSSTARNIPLIGGFMHHRGQFDRIQYNSLNSKNKELLKRLTSRYNRIEQDAKVNGISNPVYPQSLKDDIAKARETRALFKASDKDLKAIRKANKAIFSSVPLSLPRDSKRREAAIKHRADSRNLIIDNEIESFNIYQNTYDKYIKNHR